MPGPHLRFDSVTFTYDTQPQPLFDTLSFTAAEGWTGIVGPNGSGKSTLLSLAAGEIAPLAGRVEAPAAAVLCRQRTDRVPPALTDLLSFADADAGRLVSILGIEADWPYRWETLSHGERKRAQIGAALCGRPELLLLDEPTNHLDRAARRMLSDALATFDGVGLLVSHDRDLLDALCARTLFLSEWAPPVLRPGGVTDGLREMERQRLGAERDWARVAAQERRVRAEMRRRRAVADRQDARRSKKKLDRHDSDGRARIDLARVTGKDGQAGRLLRQLEGRAEQIAAERSATGRPVRERTGVTLNGSRSGADSVVRAAAACLALGTDRWLVHPEIAVSPADRIALTGPNGSGKSTLLRHLLAARSDDPHVVTIPQELSESDAAALRARFDSFTTEEQGRILSTVSRLGSSVERVRSTERLSPGEARKLLLAIGLERRPHLVVMDEPTNHMDPVSAEAVATALESYDGALILVSHEEWILERLTDHRWTVRCGPDGEAALELG